MAVAAGEAEIVAAVEQAGGRAVLTDPGLPSGSDRIHAALQILDPDGRHDVVVNLQGDLPALDPAQIRAVAAALDDSGADIATLAAEITDPAERDNPSVVKAVVAWDETGGWAARFISPAPPRLRAMGPCFIMSASMPIAAKRWRGLSLCRLRPWRRARSWSSCAPWKRI